MKTWWKTELDNGEAEFAAKSEEGKQKLDAAYSEIQNGQDELNNGYAQLEAAEKTLADKKKEANIEFDAAKEEIEEGQKQIDDAKKELSEGEKEYNKAVADAESQIKDGAERIQNARNIEYYNLDMIIALGYRVQSQVAPPQRNPRRPRQKPFRLLSL